MTLTFELDLDNAEKSAPQICWPRSFSSKVVMRTHTHTQIHTHTHTGPTVVPGPLKRSATIHKLRRTDAVMQRLACVISMLRSGFVDFFLRSW